MTITVSEVESRLGRVLESDDQTRLWHLIQDTTAVVESLIGTDFTASGTVTDETPTPRNLYLVLDRWPVTAITSVQDDDGTDLAHVETSLRDGVICLDAHPFNGVNVTYTYGWASIPPIVTAVVAQVAGRALGTPADRAGITSETTGPYNFQIGAAAGAGPVGLLNSEAAAVKRLVRKLPNAAIGSIELVDWLA